MRVEDEQLRRFAANLQKFAGSGVMITGRTRNRRVEMAIFADDAMRQVAVKARLVLGG